jgi:predicted alpha/beta superfamily hydrolase
MHDGQNLFDPEIAFGGGDWGLHEALVRLAVAGNIPETMVAASWNTGERCWLEYIPHKPLASPGARDARERFVHEVGGMPRSDAYLRFLVEEVKPFVQTRYHTLPGRETTVVMGSSMAGLVSLYALCEYPAVFGGAGCLSTTGPPPATP